MSGLLLAPNVLVGNEMKKAAEFVYDRPVELELQKVKYAGAFNNVVQQPQAFCLVSRRMKAKRSYFSRPVRMSSSLVRLA